MPPPGKSPTIDAIKKRGALRAAAIGEFPWLPENTSGSGPQFSGPAWVLANEYAKRLGVKLDIVPVSHETKVPILATGDADISIAPLSVTPQRQKVVDFIVYSKSSLCFFGRADNPKLKDVKTVDDLNRPDITMAYFSGTPPEAWAPTRFDKVKFRAVAGSGANAPVEEMMSKRADVAPDRLPGRARSSRSRSRAWSCSRRATTASRATRCRPPSASRSTRRTRCSATGCRRSTRR